MDEKDTMAIKSNRLRKKRRSEKEMDRGKLSRCDYFIVLFLMSSFYSYFSYLSFRCDAVFTFVHVYIALRFSNESFLSF